MYTATITEVTEESKGNYVVTAEASNGTETFTKVFRGIVSKEGAEGAVKAWVNSMQLNPPVIGVVKLVPDAPPVPTAEEIKEAEISAKKNELETAYSEFQKKIITEAEYDAVVAQYKTLVSEIVAVK